MKNKEIAQIFSRIADLMEILGEDRFRVGSYRKASRTVGELVEPIEEIASAGELQKIPGVGKGTAGRIEQYLRTGKVAILDELLAKVPPELPDMLAIAGLGPRTAARLWTQGGITSPGELKKALVDEPERLKEIEGIGAKKIGQMLEAIEFMESAGGRMRLDEAAAIAAELTEVVGKCKGVRRVVAAGSLRRGKETVGDIDLLCEAPKSAGRKIIETFTAGPDVSRVLAAGATKGSVVLEGDVQADLRVVVGKSFGAALCYFTGSKAHNIRVREVAVKKGLRLNEYGLFKGDRQVAGADEEGIYSALGLAFVPPEVREDRGEIEAAGAGKVPQLVSTADIRGDLHVHTRASDGTGSIDQMIAACRERGYAYMGICDHSKSQVQANGLDEKRLAKHAAAIRKAAGKYDDILVLAGVEVDIFKDGTLDFSAGVLAELDFVTASAHSALFQSSPEATRRTIKAIEHPYVHCIGHPSGRLINSRPGMEIDIEEVAAAAAANNVALEINAHPMRLDLRDTHVRAAVDAGAKIIINTDAHSIGDLDLMTWGVTTARRGWARAQSIVNTWTRQKLLRWLGRKRVGGQRGGNSA